MRLTIEAEIAPLRIAADGTVYVGKTRVPIDTIIEAFSEGYSAEEIAMQYPTIEIGDSYAVIAYYLRHRSQVEIYLDDRRKEADRVRRNYETRFPPKPGLRERLIARDC